MSTVKRKKMSRDTTKPTKWLCVQRRLRSAWASASLGICPVWSESSLLAWRKLCSLTTHWVHGEVWSDWADAQADLSLRWAHPHFVGFVMRWLKCETPIGTMFLDMLDPQMTMYSSFSYTTYAFYSRHNTVWIANTKFGLDPTIVL